MLKKEEISFIIFRKIDLVKFGRDENNLGIKIYLNNTRLDKKNELEKNRAYIFIFSTSYLHVMIALLIIAGKGVKKRNGSLGIYPAAPATSRLRKGYIFYSRRE